jgi:hypothetical protein
VAAAGISVTLTEEDAEALLEAIRAHKEGIMSCYPTDAPRLHHLNNLAGKISLSLTLWRKRAERQGD